MINLSSIFFPQKFFKTFFFFWSKYSSFWVLPPTWSLHLGWRPSILVACTWMQRCTTLSTSHVLHPPPSLQKILPPLLGIEFLPAWPPLCYSTLPSSSKPLKADHTLADRSHRDEREEINGEIGGSLWHKCGWERLLLRSSALGTREFPFRFLRGFFFSFSPLLFDVLFVG